MVILIDDSPVVNEYLPSYYSVEFHYIGSEWASTH